MEERCKLCNRRQEEAGLCIYHQMAHTRLKEAFSRWRRALGIDWKGFLIEVSGNPGTGEWVREVAYDLLHGRHEASEANEE